MRHKFNGHLGNRHFVHCSCSGCSGCFLFGVLMDKDVTADNVKSIRLYLFCVVGVRMLLGKSVF